MKKIFTGILAFVYITIASGVALNIHYCMGKLSGVEYAFSTNDKCDKCGMENKKGCCHSEFKIVKLADDQQLAKANINFSQAPVLLNIFSVDFPQSVQGDEKNISIQYHSPPDYKGSSVYLYNCVFRV